jgi:hypothetical protein
MLARIVLSPRPDADAEWGISYVKVDSCGGNRSMTNQGVWDQHVQWRTAINATGRRMWLSICPQYVYEDGFPDMHCTQVRVR